MNGYILGVTESQNVLFPIIRAVLVIPLRWGNILREPARMVRWIWLAMCGNGWRIYMIRAITLIPPQTIHKGQPPGIFESCGEVRGSTTPGFSSALPTVDGTIPRVLTTL